MRFVFSEPVEPVDALRARMRAACDSDETEAVRSLLGEAALTAVEAERAETMARELALHVRAERRTAGGIDALLHTYDLSTREGVALMCLAEALLRVPDPATAERLIRDKIGGADWQRHLGDSESLFVNASTWGLMLTGRVVGLDPDEGIGGLLPRLVNRLGEPVIREAMVHAMRVVGQQFVMGRGIGEALDRARRAPDALYSFDMLGEAARTAEDAARYLQAYRQAIDAVGTAAAGVASADPGVSVKLSALHPRYEVAQRGRVLRELVPRFVDLASRARARSVALTMDAEEAARLDLSLEVFEAAARAPSLDGWDGLGLAVQAYQKRAVHVIEWLGDLADEMGRRIPVRLVKGAYWDTEIKRAQERGLAGFPVFTRKASTDVSYIACARLLLAKPACFYPQFATHNAHTLATVLVLAGDERDDFEFQRLHGMGEALYRKAAAAGGRRIRCRVYAPVGSHEELLSYLVRRLLENGANTSFVNRVTDDALPVDALIENPVDAVREAKRIPHPGIASPAALYGPARRNARGLDLDDMDTLGRLAVDMADAAAGMPWRAEPTGGTPGGQARDVVNPADRRQVVGEAVEAEEAQLEAALAAAANAAPEWAAEPAGDRAACLERAADLLEANMAEALAIAVLEAGKTLADGVAEVREAVDFCRYYAMRTRADFAAPAELPGPTGETNRIALCGRGVFACISPWNFPLAIFCGQVTAALAAGNAVVAKPAEQTPLMAAFATRMLHRAGIPRDALQLLPGTGEEVGARLVADRRIDGVAFTGSTETARAINRSLAAREGPIVPLIAETGGQNAMIVDSTALPEQVTADVIHSAFNSAGQRCSALRVLCLQDDTAERIIAMLTGAMAELKIGDPALIETDVGPVIDEDARSAVEDHVARMAREARILHRCTLEDDTGRGSFVAPALVEIDRISVLEREVFGPVVHVLRFRRDRLEALIDEIEATGYGLTLGIHSRIDSVARRIAARARVGNIYVNRNMVGAVVGSQPFGGEGLSGTGPKAGGPRYLHRFAVERVVSTDTTAAGGNAALMALGDAP